MPTPAPAPAELRADEPTRAGPPPAAAAETSATGTAPAYSVAATQFSAAWPAAPNAAATSAHDVPTVGSHDNTEAAAAAAQTPVEDTAAAGLARHDGGRSYAAAQPSEPAPGVAHLVLFLSATAAFVAIAFRTVLKLAAARRGQGDRRPAPRAAGPVIRQRAPELRVSEPSIEAMSEPAIARLREIAKRWDTPARVPHQPRLPTTFEAEPDHDGRGSGAAATARGVMIEVSVSRAQRNTK